MRQEDPAPAERRREPREPKGFAFWFRSAADGALTSAWMLDVSTEGAALLTAVTETPPVGQRIELLEMPAHDRLVREDSTPPARFARVLRHDEVTGITRRVAIRFESDADMPLTQPGEHLVSASLDRARVAPSPPPVVDGNRGVIRRPHEV